MQHNPHRSTTVRFLIIAALSLGMSVPLLFVGSIVWDRQSYYNDARSEVSQAWGGRQTLAGPFLIVDELYRCRIPDDARTPRWNDCRARRVFLPTQLDVQGELRHQLRQRAIYEIPVYQSDLTFEGVFALPGPTDALRLDLETAEIVFGITHTQALATRPQLSLAGKQVALEATTGAAWIGSGVRARASIPEDHRLPFRLAISARGSDVLALSPIGDDTHIELRGTWPHPSFSGRYLPQKHEIGRNGFLASWSVHALARELPSHWRATDEAIAFGGATLTMHEPITDYRLVNRGVKYGILFISLTFVAFLCFELGSGMRLHYVQYGVVGAGLSVFYLAALSLSEHLPFAAAYALATLLITALIGWYIHAITRRRRASMLITGIIAALYTKLYVLLTLEDYALLAGTFVLLAGLAALMYTTRHLHQQETAQSAV
jgi:inner membrane protein